MKPANHNKIKQEGRIRSKKYRNPKEEKMYADFFHEYNEGVMTKRFDADVLPSLIKRN